MQSRSYIDVKNDMGILNWTTFAFLDINDEFSIVLGSDIPKQAVFTQLEIFLFPSENIGHWHRMHMRDDVHYCFL